MERKEVVFIAGILIMTIFSVFESNFQNRIIGLLISIIILLALIYFELAGTNTKNRK